MRVQMGGCGKLLAVLHLRPGITIIIITVFQLIQGTVTFESTLANAYYIHCVNEVHRVHDHTKEYYNCYRHC